MAFAKRQVVTPKGKSQWVYRGRDGKLVYKKTPEGDKIMDFSYAGYMGGGVALPTVPVKVKVKPSGGDDDTKLIQSAINEVAAMPMENHFRGAVLLEAGVYTCAGSINISASGVVLRGSGSSREGTVIKMTGARHTAIVIGEGRNPRVQQTGNDAFVSVETTITDNYVPSGAISFRVVDTKGLAVGDMIEIRKPVTEQWIHFMNMDNLTRDGKPQTWLHTGTNLITRRTITKIQLNTITIDVPLSDNINSKYINPLKTAVVKIQPPALVTNAAVENLHIQAPPMEMSYHQAPYSALKINGQDCWAKEIKIEETMNSVSITGKRITLQLIDITRTVPNLGASKPAEFAPNASQLLLDRCSSIGDNIWHAATGGGLSGPIVMLNCTFGGNGHIEGHQRWTTGILLDNCRLPEGGIDFKNRGSMGSGHGWGTGWSVAWNCIAKEYVVQQPPGAYNWMIGCIGPNIPTPQPFNTSPMLSPGISDSQDIPVSPQSLYLAQLTERMGVQAIKNLGYDPGDPNMFSSELAKGRSEPIQTAVNVFGRDLAAFKYANPSNIRSGKLAFGGEKAFDSDNKTYWTTNENITEATLEVDLEKPQMVHVIELREPKGLNHVQAYKVEGMVNSDWKLLSEGTTIGDRKVDKFTPVLAWKVRLTIIKANASPAISTFSIYGIK
jgi:hypothetical protein